MVNTQRKLWRQSPLFQLAFHKGRNASSLRIAKVINTSAANSIEYFLAFPLGRIPFLR
jgi:hypothetical protein